MIRIAQVHDAAAIAAIHVRGWQAAYGGVFSPTFLEALSIDRRSERWRRILAQPRSGTLVYVENERVVGWIDHGPSRDADRAGEAEVYALYVAPGQWGSGTGTRLIHRAELDIFSRGITRVSLWVLEQNAQARGFYERRGFTDDGMRKRIEIGGVSLVEMRYEKRNPEVGDLER